MAVLPMPPPPDSHFWATRGSLKSAFTPKFRSSGKGGDSRQALGGQAETPRVDRGQGLPVGDDDARQAQGDEQDGDPSSHRQPPRWKWNWQDSSAPAERRQRHLLRAMLLRLFGDVTRWPVHPATRVRDRDT